ncbi:MAG: hypothetical protein ACXAEU_22090 [Candidatus Hodarchaeales archaeon]|jgi:hypothetical protein
MKISNITGKKSGLAILGGSCLAIVIFGSAFLLPGLLDAINPGQDPGEDSLKLGSKIAKYMESRESEIMYGWCYNNSFVNVELSGHFGFFVDGLKFESGDSDGSSSSNISLLHDLTEDTVEFDFDELTLVVDEFELVMDGLDEDDLITTNINMILPQSNFLWDIIYDDGTSLSIVYSQELNAFSVINGTWDEIPIHDHQGNIAYTTLVINYSAAYEDAAYFKLDDDAETAVLSAIETLKTLIIATFE